MDATDEALASMDAYRRRRAPKTYRVVTYRQLSLRDAHPVEWVAKEMIPRGSVTSLYGVGSIGKSMLAMQLAECIATGQPFMGIDVMTGTVLTLMHEDDEDEQTRRIHRLGGSAERVLSVADDGDEAGPCMMRFDLRGRPQWTEAGERFEATVAEHRPLLSILDPIALIYGGNENDRTQVSAFAHRLKWICAKYRTTILLIGHPAKAEGSEFSGSTAWDTAVRSRLILKKKENTEREYLLQRPKSNYAPRDSEGLHLIQKIDGTFDLADSTSIERRRRHEIKERMDQADALVLRFIESQHAQGKQLPTKSTGPSGVFHLMRAVNPLMAEGFTAQKLADAATRLLEAGKLREVDRTKPDRHKTTVLAPAGVA